MDSKSVATPQNHTVKPGENQTARKSCAEACAELAANPDLAAVVAAWPMLPADVRKMIRGVVGATIGAGEGKRRR
jgi:hypothetical protein